MTKVLQEQKGLKLTCSAAVDAHVGVKIVYGTDEEGQHTVTLLQDQSIEKMQRPVSDRDSPPFSPLSEDDDPGKQASKRSPEYSPVTDDDERPELKRLKQRENVTTVINSESFTPMTPPTEEKVEVKVEVKAETDDLFLANAAASLTT